MEDLNQPLQVLRSVPDRLHQLDSTDVLSLLGQPTLFTLQGKKDPALFVSCLLHGNEYSGFEIMKKILKKYDDGKSLPRSLYLLVGNVRAAREGVRRLDSQPDYNRIWGPKGQEDYSFPKEVMNTLQRHGVYAAVDIHNTSGRCAPFAAVNRLEAKNVRLAQEFSSLLVYFTEPASAFSVALTEHFPAITYEAGVAGDLEGIRRGFDAIDRLLQSDQLSEQPYQKGEATLFEMVAQVSVPRDTTIGFEISQPLGKDLNLDSEIDTQNFMELPEGYLLAKQGSERERRFVVTDVDGKNITSSLFDFQNNEIRLKKPTTFSLLNKDEKIIRQDCFAYVMGKVQYE